ncbi:unnamed protein product [Amoebophrya sp. A25]|nr:unnamed protein product [Amoebophrya sp. A25]|eukprot:GSA25T00006188001.1
MEPDTKDALVGGGGFSASSASSPPHVPYTGTPKILLLGDSLTQQGSANPSLEDGKGFGWAALLQNLYIRRADVLNRGLSGWTSRWARRYVSRILNCDLRADEQFLFATVWLGANDAWLKEADKSGRYSVTADEYEENMTDIVSQVLARTPVLFILAPSPIAENARKAFAQAMYGEQVCDRINAHTSLYRDAVKRVAEKAQKQPGKKVVFMDLFELFYEQREQLLPDGLHFGNEAHRMLYDALEKMLHAEGLGIEITDKRKGAGSSLAISKLLPSLPWHDDAAALP